MNIRLKLKSNRSENFLAEIANELKKRKLKPGDLTSLEIEFPQECSFTGAKVRAAILNTLCFALDIPINKTKKVGDSNLGG